MAEQEIKTRIKNLHGTEEQWNAKPTFVPNKAELVVYDPDSDHAYARFKIGDGVNFVTDLPFAGAEELAEALAGYVTLDTEQTITGKKIFQTAASGQFIVDSANTNNARIRLQQKKDIDTLVLRTSGTAGAVVWSQPESNAALYFDFGPSNSKVRVQFPSTKNGILALDTVATRSGKTGVKGLLSGEGKVKLDCIRSFANTVSADREYEEGIKIGTINISGVNQEKFNTSGTVEVVEDTVDFYIPNYPTELKSPFALKIGEKSYDGSAEVALTADDFNFDLNFQPVGDYVTFTKRTGISLLDNTNETIYEYGQSRAYFKNGLVVGLSAKDKGLVVRGISGCNTPVASGSAQKDNLFINYDGDNDYKNNRHLILQAGAAGTHYGNNVYQYAAVRGDAMKAYLENYVSTNYQPLSSDALETTATTVVGAINELLDRIDDVAPTNYYWANVPISATSSASTSPTFQDLTTTRNFSLTGAKKTVNGVEYTPGIKLNNGYINITGSQNFAEGLRLHPIGNLSSIWFNAINESNYDKGGMWGITAYDYNYSDSGKKNTFRFRGPDSNTATAPTDQMWINGATGKVTSRGGFVKNGSSDSYVLLAGGGTKALNTFFSGSYSDLTNTPTLFSGSYNDLTDKPTLFSGSYDDLTNKPTLFSGSYNDLIDVPTIPEAYTLPAATASELGGIKVGANLTVDADGTLNMVKADVTDALGYTPMSTAGGTFTNTVAFVNNKGIYIKDKGGTARSILFLDNSDNIILGDATMSTASYFAIKRTMRPSNNTGNVAVQLGTSEKGFDAVYATKIYQGSKQVANKEDLTNFITASSLPTKLGDLTNDVGYITGISGDDVTTALGYIPLQSSDLPTVPTKVSELTNDSGFITGITRANIESALSSNSAATIKSIIKIQNGSGTGGLVLGANSTSTSVTAGNRHLGRISMPVSEDITLMMLLLSSDTNTDSSSAFQPASGTIQNRLELGGRPGATGATAPDVIAFTVANVHNTKAQTEKTYALEMNAAQARFNVMPNYQGTEVSLEGHTHASTDLFATLQDIKVGDTAGTENTAPTFVTTFSGNNAKNGLSHTSMANLGTAVSNYITYPNRLKATQGANEKLEDPNNATQSGFYYINGSTNRPAFSQSANVDYRVLSTFHSEPWGQQIATDFRCNDIFYRRKQQGTWTSWMKIYPVDSAPSKVVLDTTSKKYLLGVTTAPTASGINSNTTADTAIYAENGKLNATQISVAEKVEFVYNSTDKCLDIVFK